MRRLPHAGDHVHGRRSAPRSQLARAATRSVGEARRAECVQRLPREPIGGLGRDAPSSSGTDTRRRASSSLPRRSQQGRKERRARSACSQRWSPTAASLRSPARARSRGWSVGSRQRRLRSIRDALGDASSLVRRAAVHALADAESAIARGPRLTTARRRGARGPDRGGVGDGRRAPGDLLPATRRGALERATAEFVAAQELNGDRPEAHLALATLYANQQELRARGSRAEARTLDRSSIRSGVGQSRRPVPGDGPRQRRRAHPARRARAHAGESVAPARARARPRAREAPARSDRIARRRRAPWPGESAPWLRVRGGAPRRGQEARGAARAGGRAPAPSRTIATRSPRSSRIHREAGDLRRARTFAEQLDALDPE